MDLAHELHAVQPLLHRNQVLRLGTVDGPLPFRGTRGMLVSVKSLLEKAGGDIRFISVPRAGTLFKVRLPRAS